MAATYQPLSAQVVYASRSGVPLDGVTDATAAIQAILDRFGAAGTPLAFVLDGPAAANTLYLYSYQTFCGAGTGSLTKLPYPTTNGLFLLTNKHWTTTGTTPTDQYIIIRDLYIDGNRRNYACGVNNSSTPYVNANAQVVPTIGLYGVNKFQLENVRVYDSPAYGFHLANAWNGTLVNISKFSRVGDTINGDDIYHLNGGCTNIHCFGISGTCNDDALAFNADDGQDQTSPTSVFYPGTVLRGPITHCSVRGGMLAGSGNAGGHMGGCISSYPADYIQDIVISGVSSHSIGNGFQFQNLSIPGGNGWIDSVRLEDCVVYIDGTTSGRILKTNTINCGRIEVRNCTVIPTVSNISNTALIWIQSVSTVSSLLVEGLDLEDPNGYQGAPLVVLAGTVNHCEVRSTRMNRGTSSTLAQPAISATGTVNRLQVIGGLYDRISNVVNVSAGTTTDVSATGYSHTNAGGGASFAQSGGTFSRLRASCSDTALLSSGTIASNKNDGTQDS